MNITKFSQACVKLLIILAGAITLTSCEDDKPQEQEKNNFLGSPAAAQINLRFIPKNWYDKHLFDSLSNNNNHEKNEVFSSFLDESPSLTDLGKNFLKLEPDLSKNWIISAGIFKETKFISVYLKIGQSRLIESLIDAKSIKAHQNFGGIHCLQVDEKLNKHHFILYDQEHLIIIKSYGSEEESNTLIHECVYSSKELFISYFNELFFEHRNDLDIRIKGDDKIAKLIPEPILKAVCSKFNGIVSLNLKENQVSLDIESFQEDYFLDTLFQTFNPIEEKIASAQTYLQLASFSNFLNQFGYLDDINYELNKGKIDLAELQKICSGELCLSYEGIKTYKEKTITYAYDDDFNEQEKIVYKSHSSYDFSGKIGSKTPNKPLNLMLNRQFISKTSEGKYEPILGSKSSIYISENYLNIGNPIAVTTEKLKLLLSIQEPKPILKLIQKESLLNVFPLASASLKMDVRNNIYLEINTTGEAYDYVKRLVHFANPESFQ